MSQYPKKELAQLVLQQCLAYKIKNVVISPGSRNAPLTIGFVNHPEINALSVVDERSAAFFALGMAQQTQDPVAILCTSGSALLNYYPAVAEAFYSNIPLIVISADRPAHLIDIGDGQTIRQENVFENHILFSANLKEDISGGQSSGLIEKHQNPTQQAYQTNLVLNNERIINALEIATSQKGPVHINVPFDEPLYETTDKLTSFDFKIEQKKNKTIENSLLDEIPLEVEELQKFADIWNASSKKMLLIGEHFPDDLIQTQLSHLIKDPSVLVLTETTSNVHHAKFINNIDQLIFPLEADELKDLQPEVLITFGGMIVSKKIKQFLRSNQPKHHWHVDKKNERDTFHCLNHHFKISPQLFFSQFFFLTENKESSYQNYWLETKLKRKRYHQAYLNKTDFSDLKVFDTVLASLPDRIQLQLANSSIIRYAQLFDVNNNLQVFCNRGTSGIDGSTSTAIGAACAVDEQTVFITGDISFFYDSNALWNKYIKNDFRIILINNSGGGIFRFIPGPKNSNALEYFETPHHLNAKPICELYGLEYCSVKNGDELTAQLQNFYDKSDQPKLLEIFTPREENDKVLKNYFLNLK